MKPFINIAIVFLLATTITGSLRAQSAEVVIPVGHADAVEEIVFRPDGKYIVTGSTKDTKLWEAETGRFINTFRGAWPIVSADDQYLITSSPVRIFHIVSGDMIAELPGRSPVLSPDGQWLTTEVSTDQGRHIAVSHFPDGKGQAKLEDIGGGSLTTIISPDSKLLFVMSSEQTGLSSSTLWSKEGVKLGAFQGVWESAFSPDSKYLLVSTSLITEAKTYFKAIDVSSGKVVKTLENWRFLVAPDGKIFLHAEADTPYQVLEGTSFKPLFKTESVQQIFAISPDGSKALAGKSSPKGVVLIDTKTGTSLAAPGCVNPDSFVSEKVVGFSPDSRYVAMKDRAKSHIWLWDTQAPGRLDSLAGSEFAFSADSKSFAYYNHGTGLTRRQLDTGAPFTFPVDENTFWRRSLNFTKDGKYLAAGISVNRPDFVSIRDLATGKATVEAPEHFLCFSDDGKMVATAGKKGEVLLVREVATGKVIQSAEVKEKIKGFYLGISNARFTPDGKSLFTEGQNSGQYVQWQIPTLEHSAPVEDSPSNMDISRDGKWLARAGDKAVQVREIATNKIIRSFDVNLQSLFSNTPVFSPSSKYLAVYSGLADAVPVFNLITGKVLELDSDDDLWVDDVAFSPDEKYLLVSFFRSAEIWDLATGKLVITFPKTNSGLFGKNGLLYLGTETGIAVVKVGTWELVKTFGPEGVTVQHLDEAGGRLMVSYLSQVSIIDLNAGEEMLTLTDLDSADWVVTHRSGLFDASQGAINKLYFRSGLDLIDFAQLKERYYEPGLWKKIMSGETLRSVAGMKSIDLPPDITVGPVDAQGFLPIELHDRGGGIGEVTIYVNGKEAIKDARAKGMDGNAKSVSLKVSIANHKSLVKGAENLVAVKAWNSGHWVVSRSKVISFSVGQADEYKPSIYIIACGVSDYTGTELDLKFAAKDAEDMAQATRLGAEKLFGITSSHVFTLTTSQSKEHYPTRANILKTFEKISATARPLDVLVMYISGHGINLGGAEGDWYYLTQDAYTSSTAAYNDPAIRSQTTLSSNELVELFKKVPALKQVLIVDACASGKVVDNLMAQKDVSSTTLRALDRMRDRTGMHIITGCTADAVSYEASKYGQGVLTYSLLEGIRGAALREEQFIDVNKLFQYAEERVPSLAEGLGGIQTPQIFSPQGSQSFDIGLLSETDKKAIPIARIRAVYIRSNFQDENEMEDVLSLGKIVDQDLNTLSAKGSDAPFIFVDVREYPDACKLIGRYRKEGGVIKLKLRRKCGAEDRTFDLSADSVEKMKVEIMKVIR